MKLQELIYSMEVGIGTRYVRLAVVVCGFMALALLYDLSEYQNLGNLESMDAAQVGRNVSRGRGFTTQFVRPLSIDLVERHQQDLGQRTNDFALLEAGHPDLANPPLYPLLLAGAMRVLPFEYAIPAGRLNRYYQPDLLIALVNQALLFVLACLTFRLADRLFDRAVAWGSAIALVGSALLWRFSVSGLSTLLVLNLFVLVLLCLVAVERKAREEPGQVRAVLLRALLIGALVSLGTLTRYSFGWLIIPVTGFLLLYVPQCRVRVTALALLAFLLILSPWLVRNYSLSGTLFGTAAYACLEDVYPMNGEGIERSLETPFAESSLFNSALRKVMVNLPTILQEQVTTLGGSWIAAFFLVGLLMPFVDPGRNRLRLFVVAALVLWLLIQSVIRTYLSTEVPGVNTENLIVLLAPVVFIYGMALFFTLLEQLTLSFFRGREIITAMFLVILCAPLILALLPPRRSAYAFPPYDPPVFQFICGWMDEGDLIMSDLPWAHAWYGDRQCVWLTLNARDDRHLQDFFAIHDLRRPIRALYLTHRTLNQPFLTGLYLARQPGSWGNFVMALINLEEQLTVRREEITQRLEQGLPVEAQEEALRLAYLASWRQPALRDFPLQHSTLGAPAYLRRGQIVLTRGKLGERPTD